MKKYSSPFEHPDALKNRKQRMCSILHCVLKRAALTLKGINGRDT